MNQPDRFEKFVVPDGVKKLQYERDTKVANAGTFILQREDHSVGNLSRMQLHRDERVVFSGYRIPHPLQYQTWVKVQTDGSCTPLEAYMTAVDDTIGELTEIQEGFMMAFNKYLERQKNQSEQNPQEDDSGMMYSATEPKDAVDSAWLD